MAHQPRRIFITVAEVSGDKHAAQLIRSLRQIDPDIQIEGLGGPEMASAGALIHRDTVANAAMGLRGALRAVEVYRMVRWTRRRFEQCRPDLWIGVDSPSMNFHFAKVARRYHVPSLQYVAPQLWAWAPWRMKKLRRWLDQVACILPFEQDYFRGHGVSATFVGHPLFDQLPVNRGFVGSARFPEHPPVIGLLPGSRRSEAQANFTRMLGVARQIAHAYPQVSFLIPTTPATHPVVEAALAGEPENSAVRCAARIQRDAFDRLVPQCDLCITVSGTATLHVAALGVPMIVVYSGSALMWNLLGRWLIRTRTYALVNLLAAHSPADADPTHHAVPEFVPWYGSVDPLARMAIDHLRHPEKLAAQRERLRNMIQALDTPGASGNVAALALKMADANPS